MKQLLRFDVAWAILLLVVATMITLNFVEEESARSRLEIVVLVTCVVMFLIAIITRRLAKRIS